MAQTLPVYALVALLLVASAGPSLKAVRDASLGDLESLDGFRSLDEFPFLKQVRPYLPPLVVDWVIVQRDAPMGLPPGVDYRFDDEGRVVLVWPDGCEETEERYREGSACAPPADGCRDDPTAEGCDPCDDPANHTDGCTPPECPAGHVLDPEWPDADPACIPDPRCETDDNGTRPADCPPPGTPPPPRCADGTVAAYDGSCVAVAPTLLRRVFFDAGDTARRTLPVELKVPYANASLEVSWEGLASAGYTIKFYATDTGKEVCWTTADGGSPGSDGCNAEKTGSIGSSGARAYRDAWEGPLPQDNMTLWIEPTPAPSGSSGTLLVRLYGTPHEAEDAQDA